MFGMFFPDTVYVIVTTYDSASVILYVIQSTMVFRYYNPPMQ